MAAQTAKKTEAKAKADTKSKAVTPLLLEVRSIQILTQFP